MNHGGRDALLATSAYSLPVVLHSLVLWEVRGSSVLVGPDQSHPLVGRVSIVQN